MKKIRILFLFLISPLLLSSCLFLYKPYGIKILTELKSSNETEIFRDFATRVTLKYNTQNISVVLEYTPANKSIQAISQNSNSSISPSFYKTVKNFLDKYYLITSDNIENVFPPEWVNASFYSRKNKIISFVKYSSEQNKQNKTYKLFNYDYINGFLLLSDYCEKIEGNIDKNALIIGDFL